MLEREIKLHVPAKARLALEQELRELQATEVALHALYFDTAGRELAQAKIALRLRREGEHWIQTLKMPGTDALSRIEINHPRTEPTLDLSLYERGELQSVFTRLKHPLALCYETRIKRLLRKTRSRYGTVELAYDQGTVCAGGLELPVCEIEFELLSGRIQSLFALSKKWTQRFGLILDLRSKAERGDTLASAAQAAAGKSGAASRRSATALAERLAKPRRAGLPKLKSAMNLHQAYLACVDDCSSQIIRNATFVAGVDAAQADEALRAEHIHQLRVGIRRLRSCWKLYKNWARPAAPLLDTQLREHFAAFGETRDDDVVRYTIAPQLEHAGMPACVLPQASTHGPGHAAALASGAAFQILLLDLLASVICPETGPAAKTAEPLPNATEQAAFTPTDTGEKPLPLKAALVRRLNKWLAHIAQQGSRFQELAIEEQHDLRKKVKRLRYGLNFSETLLSRASLERILAALTQAQDTLGELNDLYVAEQAYRALLESQPQAWFAVGWLRSMQTQKKRDAQAMFKVLAKAGKLKA